MGLFVKICGIAREEDARAVAALQPDAMGFIFWPGSPRYVEPERVGDWLGLIGPGILKVGVFVDASPEEADRVARTAGLDVVQLHGGEDPRAYGAPGRRIWKVVHLDRTPDAEAAAYPVDALLIDRYSTESPGGTGLTADWNRAAGFVQAMNTPVLLAGGLRPENVAGAVERVRPWGVDVSSGVEQRPGIKDLERVRGFLELCRNL